MFPSFITSSHLSFSENIPWNHLLSTFLMTTPSLLIMIIIPSTSKVTFIQNIQVNIWETLLFMALIFQLMVFFELTNIVKTFRILWFWFESQIAFLSLGLFNVLSVFREMLFHYLVLDSETKFFPLTLVWRPKLEYPSCNQ